MFTAKNLARGVDKNCHNIAPKPSTDAQLKGIFMGFDTNRNCEKSAPVPLTDAQLKGIFMRFDTNNDGRLSKQELKNAFNSLGAQFPAWRAYRALHRADGNGDGYISEDELGEVVKYASRCGYTIK